MAVEGASALQVLRRGDQTFVAVDSLVDAIEHMASMVDEGPGRTALTSLADGLRPMSSYAELETQLGGDDSTAIARRCDCNEPVIDAHQIDGTVVVIDVEPTETGPWFPLKIVDGVVTVVPWRDGLDGIQTVRLADHKCAGGN